jgi:uncharacterized protein (DUF1800 family)
MRPSSITRGAAAAVALALCIVSPWAPCAAQGSTNAAGATAAGAAAATAALTEREAAHFLDHSSFGPTAASIAALQRLGIARYLQDQFATPATGYHGYAYFPSDQTLGCPTGAATTCLRDNYSIFPVQMQFFRNALTGRDQLRQRVAFALSQIFVVSGMEIVQPYGMAAYQNLLLDDAFVNFKQLLKDVTLSPVMGDYLNMVNNNWKQNSKENDPNENYGREVLQLFSIGLVELNEDGTPKLTNAADAGSTIPTFGQDQVEGFSAVFTGWTYAPRPGVTGKWTNSKNYDGVMNAFDTHHDNAGGETLLKGVVLPANGDQDRDLTQAIDNIFNHPNVGPFIGKQLIQQLVTSNPSPAYVKAVAAKFNDDGHGVRGDMQAVITEILTNPEARLKLEPAPSSGKLREPALFIAGMLRGIGGATQSDGEYLKNQSSSMSEPIFDANTVFNYYQPSYPLPLPDSTLVGPPFGIYDAASSFVRYNFVGRLLNGPVAPDAGVTFVIPTGTSLDLSAWEAVAGNSASLMDAINKRFFPDSMSKSLAAALDIVLDQIPETDRAGRARAALYLALTSPEYQVER